MFIEGQSYIGLQPLPTVLQSREEQLPRVAGLGASVRKLKAPRSKVCVWWGELRSEHPRSLCV